MNTRRKYIVLTLMLVLALGGCSTNESTQHGAKNTDPLTESKPIIGATNLALESMAKAIVGGFADVIRPQVQSDPESGLNMDEVIPMQRAAVVFTNGPGADDAAWLNLISLDQSRVCATTSEEFELSDFIQVEDYRTVHTHGDEGEHSHPWLVPHCWLDPRLAGAQSLSIRNRLTKAFPDQEAVFAANHRSLKQELELVEKLADEVAELIKSKSLTVIASDPRLLFFTRALKLEDNYFLWFEPPETSTAIAELEKRTPQDGESLVLLCPPTARLLAEELSGSTEIATATVSLIEKAEEGANAIKYIAELRKNYQTLKAVAEGMTH